MKTSDGISDLEREIREEFGEEILDYDLTEEQLAFLLALDDDETPIPDSLMSEEPAVKKISNQPEEPPKVVGAPPEIASCAVPQSPIIRGVQQPADFFCSSGHDDECRARAEHGIWLPCEAPYVTEIKRLDNVELARHFADFRYVLQLGQAFALMSVTHEKRRVKGQPRLQHNVQLYLNLLKDGHKYPIRIIGLLHDIFDLPLRGERYTPRFFPRDLHGMEFDTDIIDALMAFSRLPEETFEDYYSRFRENEWATTIAYYDARLHVNYYRWGEKRDYRAILDRLRSKFVS